MFISQQVVIDAGLPVHGELGNQFRHLLRGKKFSTGFTRISGIIGNQKLVGIAEQVDIAAVEIAKIQTSHTFEHRC